MDRLKEIQKLLSQTESRKVSTGLDPALVERIISKKKQEPDTQPSTLAIKSLPNFKVGDANFIGQLKSALDNSVTSISILNNPALIITTSTNSIVQIYNYTNSQPLKIFVTADDS
jgi:hypothetical protein